MKTNTQHQTQLVGCWQLLVVPLPSFLCHCVFCPAEGDGLASSTMIQGAECQKSNTQPHTGFKVLLDMGFGATLCIPKPLSKPLSNCLICLFNQHANKSTYFSKATTSRNDTTIKPINAHEKSRDRQVDC